MNDYVKGKVVIITGGSSGFGLEAARLLLERGARVAITGRNADRLNAAGTAVPLRGIRSINPGDAAATVRALITASTAPQL